MNGKWIVRWLQHSLLHASFSSCPRGKVGAWLIDGRTNAPISAGYNGPPRGAGWHLCANTSCVRDTEGIPSGTQTEKGCEHAEQNAIANADGRSLRGAILVVSTPPCLACAKAVYRHGIAEVHTTDRPGYGDGSLFLTQMGIPVVRHPVPENLTLGV